MTLDIQNSLATSSKNCIKYWDFIKHFSNSKNITCNKHSMIMMMSVIKQLMYEYLCYSCRTFSPIRGYLSAISFNFKKI